MVTVGDALKIAREDLLGFPEDTVKLILQMQKDGWRASRRTNSHITLLAPDGVTTKSASRNRNSARYLAEDPRRYNKAQGKEVETVEEIKTEPYVEKYPCVQDNCNKSFNSAENLRVHWEVDHKGMTKCPDCTKTYARPASLGLHRANKHGYVSPTKHKRDSKKGKKENRPTITENVASALFVDRMPKILTPHAEDIVGSTVYGERKGPVIDFIDERDSWVFDFSDVTDRRVGTLQQILNAAGLKMEIRVWREKDE